MTWVDALVMFAYAGALLAVGIASARGQHTAADLSLGGRRLPTWVVLCSMTATELSAATFIGVPHAAYTGDWSYLQLAVGALLAKWLLAARVIPLYHRLGIVTVYGYLARRFGPEPHRMAAITFIVGRVFASGARLFIAALAVSVVTGVPIAAAVGLAGAVCAAYTLAGGIRSVVYTDALQGAVFLAAAAGLFSVLIDRLPGGLGGLMAWADAGARTRIAHIDPIFSLGDGSALGTALVGAFFLTLATHATDHDMVQRLLTTRDGLGGGRALLGSALLNFPLTLLFLVIGTGLAHFYSLSPDALAGETERVLPLFALDHMPAGLRGLVFAGLFAAAMSSLDSAICAIATTWAVDVRRSEATARDLRRASGVVSLVLMAAAIGMAAYHEALTEGASTGPSLVEFALSSMSIVYGGLLGVFAVGLTTRSRGSGRTASLGLALGAAVGLALFLHPVVLGGSRIAWTWWIPLSAAIAFAVTASRPTPTARDEP